MTEDELAGAPSGRGRGGRSFFRRFAVVEEIAEPGARQPEPVAPTGPTEVRLVAFDAPEPADRAAPPRGGHPEPDIDRDLDRAVRPRGGGREFDVLRDLDRAAGPRGGDPELDIDPDLDREAGAGFGADAGSIVDAGSISDAGNVLPGTGRDADGMPGADGDLASGLDIAGVADDVLYGLGAAVAGESSGEFYGLGRGEEAWLADEDVHTASAEDGWLADPDVRAALAEAPYDADLSSDFDVVEDPDEPGLGYPAPVRRSWAERSDERYGDRVEGWIRPQYRDEPEPVSGEYWTPLPETSYESGYGWPVPVARLPEAPPYPQELGDDIPPEAESEPTAVVPQWPPLRPANRIELPRSWSRFDSASRAGEGSGLPESVPPTDEGARIFFAGDEGGSAAAGPGFFAGDEGGSAGGRVGGTAARGDGRFRIEADGPGQVAARDAERFRDPADDGTRGAVAGAGRWPYGDGGSDGRPARLPHNAGSPGAWDNDDTDLGDDESPAGQQVGYGREPGGAHAGTRQAPGHDEGRPAGYGPGPGAGGRWDPRPAGLGSASGEWDRAGRAPGFRQSRAGDLDGPIWTAPELPETALPDLRWTTARPADTPHAAAPVDGITDSSAPSSSAPRSGVPASSAPRSGVPASGTSRPSGPASGVPRSSAPVSGFPHSSGFPRSSGPVSGVPRSSVPVSGLPQSAGPAGGVRRAGAPAGGIPRAPRPGMRPAGAKVPSPNVPGPHAQVGGASRSAGPRDAVPGGEATLAMPALDPADQPRPRPRPRPRPGKGQPEPRSTVYVSRHAAEPG